MSNIKKILKEELTRIKPGKEELEIINKNTKEIIKEMNSKIKKAKISAEIFVGGSFAKNTLIKKDKYDVDLFVRFNSKYSEEDIAKLLCKIIPKKAIKIHGSRDYYSLSNNNELNLNFEIIPTLKVTNPKDSKNITDLSYFHVSYVNNKIKKNKNLADEIMLAKAFTHYAGCYGAESYIQGFSGYATELLIIYYKSLENFMKTIAKSKEQIFIDIEKYYKNKDEILMKLNEAKLQSRIILIDPTFKDRNAMASLSDATFDKFKSACEKFILKPSLNFFTSVDKEQVFKKKYSKSLTLEIESDRQAGDIAGTKLKKFYGYFINELERFFEVKASDFVYLEKENKARIFFVCEAMKERLYSGPPVKMEKALKEFKKKHKKIIIKKGQAFASEKNFKSFKEFLSFFENKYSEVIGSMGVRDIKICDYP